MPEIESLNHLSTPELENGKIVFVKGEKIPKLTNSSPAIPLGLNLSSVSDPLGISTKGKAELKKVEQIFKEL